MPGTGSLRISGSFNLFPRHCILPTFTREQHATEVHNELKEEVEGLSKHAKKRLLKAMTKAIEDIKERQANPPQRVVDQPTSEGGNLEQRVGPVSPVTTTNNQTAPVTIQAAHRTHTHSTRKNTPGITAHIERPKEVARKSPRLNPQLVPKAPIVAITPNSERIPFFSTFFNHRIISQEVINLVTQRVWDTPGGTWTPKYILVHSPTERASVDGFHGVDIDHFCAAAVHLDTG